jgi:hypothetical protein
MHLLDFLSLSLKLPAKEGVLYSPVHSISSDFSQKVSGYSDFELISSPFNHVSTQDELSPFFKYFDNLLNLHGLLSLLEDLLIVSIVFDS